MEWIGMDEMLLQRMRLALLQLQLQLALLSKPGHGQDVAEATLRATI